MTVLVTHPGRQHSHQAALALEQAGLLAGYWAGVPSRAEHGRWIPRPLWRRLVRYAPVPLPLERTRFLPLAPALRQVAHRLPQRIASELDFFACRAFDRAVARRLARLPRSARPRAVLACEISACATFEVARRLGIATWLDAPSIHRLAQDRLHGTTDAPGLHARIAAVKDREIALADAIVTVSRLARGTYVDAGVDAAKVHAVALGADLELFGPAASEPVRGPGVRALFAGAQIVRKGYDLLLPAFARVAREHPSIELRVVGPRGDATGALAAVDAAVRDRISFAGSVTQAELAREMAAADLLVLPSRNDSYGMVVAEALAAGLPVLASDMVGAADLLTPGETGWIVSAGDLEALVATFRGIVADPAARAALAAMRPRCRRAAESATWDAYRARFAMLARELLREGAP